MFSNIDNLSKHSEEDTGDNEIFLQSIKEGSTERLRRTEKCKVTICRELPHHTTHLYYYLYDLQDLQDLRPCHWRNTSSMREDKEDENNYYFWKLIQVGSSGPFLASSRCQNIKYNTETNLLINLATIKISFQHSCLFTRTWTVRCTNSSSLEYLNWAKLIQH